MLLSGFRLKMRPMKALILVLIGCAGLVRANAQAEVIELRAQSGFGDKRVVIHTATRLELPNDAGFRVERIGGNPDLDQAPVCRITIYFAAGTLDSSIEVRNVENSVVEQQQVERLPVGFTLVHEDARDPNCLSLPHSFTARAQTEWWFKPHFGDHFGRTQSSLEIAITPVVEFEAVLDSRSGSATLRMLNKFRQSAVSSFYYQDSKDRAEGMGATLKDQESPTLELLQGLVSH